MKFVITGSSGYVGSYLVNRLLEDSKNTVLGVDRITPQRQFHPNFNFMHLDLSSDNLNLCSEVLYEADIVIHLAAARGDWNISKEQYWKDNYFALKRTLEAPWISNIRYQIFISSVSVYGSSDTPINEEDPCSPHGAYGESKLASENLFRLHISKNALQGCIIRPSAIFSPGHPENTNVYKLIESLRSFPLPLIDGGKNYKSLTYLPNLLDLIEWCIDRMIKGKLTCATYNYVEEPVMKVVELVSALKTSGLHSAKTFRVPYKLALAVAYPAQFLGLLSGLDPYVTSDRIKKFVSNTWYDSSFIRSLGFSPKVYIYDALKETVRWHLSGDTPPTII